MGIEVGLGIALQVLPIDSYDESFLGVEACSIASVLLQFRRYEVFILYFGTGETCAEFMQISSRQNILISLQRYEHTVK